MAADNLMSFHTFEMLYPELVFTKDTSATSCYGCKGRVREKPSPPPPPSPCDLSKRFTQADYGNAKAHTHSIK